MLPCRGISDPIAEVSDAVYDDASADNPSGEKRERRREKNDDDSDY